MSSITAIGISNPVHRFNQSVLADFMERAMSLNKDDARKLKTIFKASGIQFRHSVLEDYGKQTDFSFYTNTKDLSPFPSTELRLKLFHENALTLSVSAIKNLRVSFPFFDDKKITHLISVCCTGMYAPGLDIELVKTLGLPSTTQRTSINFMGCYAAFNALKIADAVCKSNPEAQVLIVCTELCSLHFQREATDDNMLANALFADGAAAVLVQANSNHQIRLKLKSFHNDLATEGEQAMAWTIGNLGFEMKLSSYVPDIIRNGIRKLTITLLDKVEKQISDIRYFAIHPGGKKILEAIEGELGITPEQNTEAYHVLKNYGNMSSPTVLFVLKYILEKLKTEDHGEHILSFAFGPGLTLESMVLEIEAQ